jgi:pimeloyl-ACP methyl ester carboxylesterase
MSYFWRLLVLLTMVFTSGCGAQAPFNPAKQPGQTQEPGALRQSALGRAYRFRWTKCDYGNLPIEIDCGILTVPANRANPQGEKIRLAVTILRSQGSAERGRRPALEPVVVLAGQPGDAETIDIREWLENPLLRQRDIILMDLRGTGKSEPNLNCTELDHTANGYDRKALQACRQRLQARAIDLQQFTSVQSAADLNDLRLALGYESWNVIGVSYGTRVALTLLRDFPQGVRSVVLDSVYPLEMNILEEQAPNAAQAIQNYFNGCQEDPRCQYSYPDLEEVFSDLIQSLESAPHNVTVADPRTGESVEISLDGKRMAELIQGALNSPETLARIPYIIYDTQYGNDHAVAGLMFPASPSKVEQTAEQAKEERRAFAEGAFYTVLCAEEVGFNNRSAAETAARQAGLPLAELLYTQVERIFEHCRDWNVPTSAAIETQPVSSPVPALILSGEYDPLTPYRWAELAAKGLPDSKVLKFPAVGHKVFNLGNCPQGIVAEFITNPLKPLDTTCIEELQVDYWLP